MEFNLQYKTTDTGKSNVNAIFGSCKVLITSLAKEVMFLVTLVCLFVCRQHYSKSYDRIGLKFYGGVLGSTMKK